MARFPGAILLDNNAIGDAVDLGVWDALRGAYSGQLGTVEEVEIEAGTYFRRFNNGVELTTSLQTLQIHAVTPAEKAKLAVALSGVELDAGEQGLWAHGLQRKDAWILCGPDKASIRAAVRLGLKDRLVSLEELLDSAGLSTKGLPYHQTKRWLDKVRGEFVVDEALK